MDILGRKISYKNTKILITPKNKEAEDFIKKNYLIIKDLNKVCDYCIYEKKKIFVVTNPNKIKMIYNNFPSDLFYYKREEHIEFV